MVVEKIDYDEMRKKRSWSVESGCARYVESNDYRLIFFN